MSSHSAIDPAFAPLRYVCRKVKSNDPTHLLTMVNSIFGLVTPSTRVEDAGDCELVTFRQLELRVSFPLFLLMELLRLAVCKVDSQ